MKIPYSPGILILLLFPLSLLAQQTQPRITSIRQERTNIVVEVQAPAGIRRVTLECRERLGPGAWQPRAVTRLDGSGGSVTFRIARSLETELMRVRGDATDPLPSSFYSGTTTYVGAQGNSSGPVPGAFDGRTGPATGAPTEPSRDVVESDIWKIRDNTLYFFNQYRGLQLIDITHPDAPALQGIYSLPAAGEQMYLLGTEHVVLLARNGCYYTYTGDESQALILLDNHDTPEVTARLGVSGYIRESRMVGTALYIASQVYRPIPNSNPAVWEWGTLVSSFDLTDPSTPVSRGTLWYSGYGYEVAATDHYFFVIGQSPTNWWQSTVHLVDISASNGAMRDVNSVTPAGRVPDKFKVDLNGSILTLISQTANNTVLETFSLQSPETPRKLGELTVGTTERLHATRFDGNRVYIVTFHTQFQIDPLWIVDLSDPAHPAIRGHLEIPGWSTFLQPLGNRLVALGIETNRTTVSLFDVADPASPYLFSRVMLGSGWSWSEGNWDEKAFNVLADAGLILVPFQSWTTNRYLQQVQLIDLESDSLTLRGVIDHQFQPRRATVFGDRILSVSAQELLSVDATDRDHPEVRAKLDLAWPVDRVFVHGNHLLEVSGGSRSWGWWIVPDQPNPVIRVAAMEAPDRVLTSFTLSNGLPIIGATKQGRYLYVAQSPSIWYYPWLLLAPDSPDSPTNTIPFHLTIFALDNLPQLSVAGEVEVETKAQSWGSDLQALWPKPGVLVWIGGGFDYWWWPIDAPMAGVRDSVAPWFWWPSTGGQLLAFDVSHSDAPSLASEVSLLSSNNWWSFSKGFTAEGLVYLSHYTSEFVVGLELPWSTAAYTNITYNETTGESETNVYPAGAWVQRNFLDGVDYADAKNPTVRQPVNISGDLQGISHQGALLYTLASEWHWETNNNGYAYTRWTQKLDALAYDGVSAHLVDSLALASSWPRPIDVVGNNVFLGRSGYDYTTTNRYPHYLEAWSVADTGKFTQLGRLTLETPAQDLRDYPGMLAAQQSDNTILLIDLATPASLSVIGRGRPAGCLWFDISHTDGNSSDGLWIPLGGFGAGHVATTR
jgi:hypothetical protein